MLMWIFFSDDDNSSDRESSDVPGFGNLFPCLSDDDESSDEEHAISRGESLCNNWLKECAMSQGELLFNKWLVEKEDDEALLKGIARLG